MRKNAYNPTPASGSEHEQSSFFFGVFSSSDLPKFDTISKTGSTAGTGLSVRIEEPQ